MDQLIDIPAWRNALTESTTELGTRLAEFLPNLVGAVLIVLAGWVISRAVANWTSRLLRVFGFDRLATRLNLTDVLQRAGLSRTPSEIVSRALFWISMVAFLLAGAQTLGLDAVSTLVDRLVRFIPDLVGAALILLVGLPLARFVDAIASSGAAATGFAQASRLGFITRMLITGLVIVIAVEQLGVETSILVGPITALLATVGLTVGLALALGTYPIVTHILAGHFLKQRLPRNTVIEVDGERGVVERIGATDTWFRNDETTWSVPNARLLDTNVRR